MAGWTPSRASLAPFLSLRHVCLEDGRGPGIPTDGRCVAELALCPERSPQPTPFGWRWDSKPSGQGGSQAVRTIRHPPSRVAVGSQGPDPLPVEVHRQPWHPGGLTPQTDPWRPPITAFPTQLVDDRDGIFYICQLTQRQGDDHLAVVSLNAGESRRSRWQHIFPSVSSSCL